MRLMVLMGFLGLLEFMRELSIVPIIPIVPIISLILVTGEMRLLDEKRENKAAPSASSSFQDRRASAGQGVHYFPRENQRARPLSCPQ
jgi:hypothetical protein